MGSLSGSHSSFTIQPCKEKQRSDLYHFVKQLQQGPDGGGEENEDSCYDGDEGQLFVAKGKDDDKLLAVAAVVTGTTLATFTSGASVSEGTVAVVRRVCLDPDAVAGGIGEWENLLEALVQEAQQFAEGRGMQGAVALVYDNRDDCQPSPHLFQNLGFVQEGGLRGCPGVFQYSRRFTADIEPSRSIFMGRWRMDLSSCDSLWSVLRVVGVNVLVIPLVDRLSVQQHISQTEDDLNIEVRTPLGSDTIELPFDGSKTMVPGVTGGRNMQSTAWVPAPAGGKLWLKTVQVVEGTLEMPESATLFETVRSLGNGDSTLFEDVAVKINGQRVASARRVLRRLDE